MRVGVEVGGTFTDLLAVEDGNVTVCKIPSTPKDPSLGAMSALVEAAVPFAAIVDLVHGSTVATNAVLERKGARIALFVTKGFRDLLFLQRHDRKRIYDLFYRKPTAVVKREDVFEIPERLDAQGRSVLPLDEAVVADVIDALITEGSYEAVAICFLNAYINPVNERFVAQRLHARDSHLVVTCSSDVTREFREYERASTTTLAAYVQPVIDRYLNNFETSLSERAFAGRFSIMQSNGGRLPSAGMRKNAITSLFSGPAAGVIGAVHMAGLSGVKNIISFDMGGTSTDVCLVRDANPALAAQTEIGGLPVQTPVIDIETIGAGGGSIVWVDDGELLRVGPESTGADPGPACYARGGKWPAVTDAHVLRGTLRADGFLGGRMQIDTQLSETVFQPLADRFAMTLQEVADAALRVADANIVRAIQLVSTERGLDPRDFTLVPFGGAGPLHAVRVAEQLGIREVLIPSGAGVLSAYGLLAAEYQLYVSRTRKLLVDDEAPEVIRRVFAEMSDELLATCAALGLGDDLQRTLSLEMRFVGQAFEISVPLALMDIASLTEDDLRRRFGHAHQAMYAFGDASSEDVEVVSFRLGVSAAPGQIPELATQTMPERDYADVEIYENRERKACRVMTRNEVPTMDDTAGPLLVIDGTSTIYLPDQWRISRDESSGNLIARSGEGKT